MDMAEASLGTKTVRLYLKPLCQAPAREGSADPATGQPSGGRHQGWTGWLMNLIISTQGCLFFILWWKPSPEKSPFFSRILLWGGEFLKYEGEIVLFGRIQKLAGSKVSFTGRIQISLISTPAKISFERKISTPAASWLCEGGSNVAASWRKTTS